MKRKVWILVQHLLPKRNSQRWEPNLKALAYEPWNMSVRLRGRCRLTDKLSVLSKPLHARRIGNCYLDAETSSVSSIFIARGYLRSNAQNWHPFHHLPLRLECDKSMELTASIAPTASARAEIVGTKRLHQSQSPLGLGQRSDRGSRTLCPSMVHSSSGSHVGYIVWP